MKRASLYLYLAFLSAQAAALVVGWNLIAAQVGIVENPSDPYNALFFVAYVLFSTAVLILLLKFYKGAKLFIIAELFLEFFAVQLAAVLFVSETAALVLALAAVALRLLAPRSKGIVLGFGAVVVGALFGASLDLFPALLFAVLLAGYDYLAVFKTKHMVALAQGLQKRGAELAVTIGYGKDSIQLGTGDLVIPAMLIVSAAKISLFAAFCGLAGAMLGVTALIFLLEKRKSYWPALPPLVAGVLVGLAAFWASTLL
ncbi:hypothetical protein COY71_01615 [Candidatus Micrarchaeota archaeon CG_4_10_14_0_8_um_filter_60_7]|nr:MAG: hypothetical protein COY71_01615 [Candidatus Micrarchaeota archaeon CG_4_10_14_0_8_um_filter_60_7]